MKVSEYMNNVFLNSIIEHSISFYLAPISIKSSEQHPGEIFTSVLKDWYLVAKIFLLGLLPFFQPKNLLLIISHVGWFRLCCRTPTHAHAHTHTLLLFLYIWTERERAREIESEVLECDRHFVNM